MQNCCCSITTCGQVDTCINRELIEIAAGNASELPDFCSAVAKCIDAQFVIFTQGGETTLPNFDDALAYYLRSFDGYTDTGDIFLSLSDDAFTWQTVVGGGGSYTDEEAQDAVGLILTNTASVVFNYNDSAPTISASVPSAYVRGLLSAGTGLSYNTSTGVFTNTSIYTDEQAQDAVGGILGAEFTYNDSTPSITLDVGNGISKSSFVQLGQAIDAAGYPAVLLSNTEIPLADFTLSLNNKTGTGTDIAYIKFDTTNVGGSNKSVVTLQAKNTANVIFSVDNTAGSMISSYYGSGGVLAGTSGYTISGAGGTAHLFDLRGSTSSATVQVGGTDSQSWVSNGDILLGLFGTKNTGFGGVTNPLSSIHVSASTTLRIPILIESGVDPSSNYINGSIWHTANHIYARLGGVNKQLDNDFNITPNDFIQNQFVGPQSTANFWIDGHGRIDDYLQIASAGRLVSDSTGTLAVALSSSSTTGSDFRTRFLRFWDFAAPTLASSSNSYIYSQQGNFLNLHADSTIVLDAPTIYVGDHATSVEMGGNHPLTFKGSQSSVGNFNYIDIFNANTAGDSKSTAIDLSFSANRTTGGRTKFASAGMEIIDFSNTLYKGDFVVKTVSASVSSGAPTEYFRVKYDGRVIVKSLDTDLTPPTTTGTTKMVIADSAGLLSFLDIPSPGNPPVPISILLAATATNDIDSANFNQVWRWNALTAGPALTLASNTTTATAGQRLLSLSTTGINASAGITTYAAYLSNTHSGTTSINNALYLEANSGFLNQALVIDITDSSATINKAININVSGGAGTTCTGIAVGAVSGATNIALDVTAGDILFESLIHQTTSDRLVGQYSVNAKLGYVTIGSGLSLSSGVLSASVGGSQGIQSVLDTDNTLTSGSEINADGNEFALVDMTDFIVEATGDTFLKIAAFGSASNGDVLTLVDNVTGEVGWSAGGGGGGVTSFSSGDLSPLFTTNVATSTSTPALSFVLTNAGAHTYFGNNTGSTAAPAYKSNAALTRTNDTNVTLTLGGAPTTALLEAVSLTLGWTGTLAVSRGGTGLTSLGSANQLLRVNAGATALEFFTPSFLTTAITSLNGLTGATQTFATGTSGSDFNISSASTTHTFNIPDASLTARGLVTTGAQSFEGVKTFNTGVVINESGAASNFRVESDTNANAILVDATNNRVGIFTASPAYPLDITGHVQVTSGSIGIATTPSTAAGLLVAGSGYTAAALWTLNTTINSTPGSSPATAIIGNSTIVEAGSGTHTVIAGLSVSAPTITGGLATVTNTATLYISGPTSTTVTGSNNSILVDSGTTRLNGDLVLGTGTAYSSGGYDTVVRNQTSGRFEVVDSDVVGINSQSGTSYTLVIGDKGKMVQMSNGSANTLTIPTNASVAFTIGTQILIRQAGAGQTTIAPAVGVTLESADNALKARVQYSVLTLIKTATNTWSVSGDLTT